MVLDIKKIDDTFKETNFFIDTNVLYWISYSKYDFFNGRARKQAKPYLEFIDKLLDDNASFFTSIYNISELLHIIEKHEFEIYQKTNPGLIDNIKDFRKLTSRKYVKNELLTAIANIKGQCTVLEYPFFLDDLEEFIDTSDTHRCDNYDFITIKNCIKQGMLNIISDDGDFASINEINLFTSNFKVLKENNKQKSDSNT